MGSSNLQLKMKSGNHPPIEFLHKLCPRHQERLLAPLHTVRYKTCRLVALGFLGFRCYRAYRFACVGVHCLCVWKLGYLSS
jgi:hypothetical protein